MFSIALHLLLYTLFTKNNTFINIYVNIYIYVYVNIYVYVYVNIYVYMLFIPVATPVQA